MNEPTDLMYVFGMIIFHMQMMIKDAKDDDCNQYSHLPLKQTHHQFMVKEEKNNKYNGSSLL